VAILAVLVAVVQCDRLPFIGGGTTYHADFADAAGSRSATTFASPASRSAP